MADLQLCGALCWEMQTTATKLVPNKGFYYKLVICFLEMVCFPSTGDVHVGMVDRGGQLEVEVNQARGLIPKPGSRNIPSTHCSDIVQKLHWLWPPCTSFTIFLCVCLCVCCFCSDICQGVCPGEWSVLGQEENQSSEEESGPHLPAGSVVWWESSGQGPTGKGHPAFRYCLISLSSVYICK